MYRCAYSHSFLVVMPLAMALIRPTGQVGRDNHFDKKVENMNTKTSTQEKFNSLISAIMEIIINWKYNGYTKFSTTVRRIEDLVADHIQENNQEWDRAVDEINRIHNNTVNNLKETIALQEEHLRHADENEDDLNQQIKDLNSAVINIQAQLEGARRDLAQAQSLAAQAAEEIRQINEEALGEFVSDFNSQCGCPDCVPF